MLWALDTTLLLLCLPHENSRTVSFRRKISVEAHHHAASAHHRGGKRNVKTHSYDMIQQSIR